MHLLTDGASEVPSKMEKLLHYLDYFHSFFPLKKKKREISERDFIKCPVFITVLHV